MRAKKSIMDKLNSPILAGIVLVAFVVFCRYCWQESQKPTVVVPIEKQAGYSRQQVKAHGQFIAMKLKEYDVVTYSQQIIDVFGQEGK